MFLDPQHARFCSLAALGSVKKRNLDSVDLKEQTLFAAKTPLSAVKPCCEL